MSWFSPTRWLLLLGLCLSLTVGYYSWRSHEQGIGYDKAKAECVAAADHAARLAQDQRDKQAAAAAAAAASYEQSRAAWEKTLKVTKHDLYTATENLATCWLSADSVRLLNNAGSGDSQSP